MGWKEMLREIEIPPLWLAIFALAGWGIGQILPVALPFGRELGPGLVAIGLALMGAAAAQMVARHTSFIPRRDPQALVTSGVFALSRNPIYLGDAFVLAGLLLIWQAALGLWLVPAFMAFITRRYIRAEEAMIGAHFGPAYAAYRARTRRWL